MNGKWLALTLALLVALSPVCLAAEIQKDEVIYAVLAPDGEAQGVYAVNGFELTEETEVRDWGEYAAVQNLSTLDELSYSNGEVSFRAQPGRFYYQGTLAQAELPWIIAIEYRLNGVPVSSETLSGASGALEIVVSIRKNPACAAVFAEGCAVQTSLALDASRCLNVKAEGATVASAGSDIQISFTMLPGAEADYLVSADVTDFAMDGIQFAGVPFALSMDLDVSAYAEPFTKLVDGVSQLASGAAALSDGVSGFQSGLDSLASSASGLLSGLGDAASAAAALATEATGLVEAAEGARDGLASLANEDGSSKLAEAASANRERLEALEAQIAEADAQLAKLGEGEEKQSLAARRDAYRACADLLILSGDALDLASTGTQAAADGLDALIGSLKTHDENAKALSQGVTTAQGGAASLTLTLKLLGINAVRLADGAKQLSDGLALLDEQVSGIDIEALVNDAVSSLTGSGEPLPSFVSAKNTSVRAVQFVCMTKGIAAPAKPAPEETATPEKNVFDRFLDLFR